MVILHSTWLYINLLELYFTLCNSTLLYHSSTSHYWTLHYSTIVLLHSTWLYNVLPWIYFALLDSTLLYHSSPLLYLNLHYSTMALNFPTLTSFLHHSSASLYLSLCYSIMALLHSTWLYIIPLWVYFTLLDSTLVCQSCTSLYMAMLDITLP